MASLTRIAARTCQALLALGAAACVSTSVDASDNDIELPERQDSPLDGEDAGLSTDEQRGPATKPNLPSSPTNDDAGAPAVDAAPPPPKAAWFQANGLDCTTFCSGRRSINVASPEGAKCTSGENIPQSALTAKITYDKCFPNCNAHLAGSNARSDGERCYADGQKKDDDNTDTTRGCFCQ